jgi:hypothetical protein
MKRVPKLFRLSRVFRAATDDDAVHFHTGPQGQPSPCYEQTCPIPRLSVEDANAD